MTSGRHVRDDTLGRLSQGDHSVPLRCIVEVPKGGRNKYQWDRMLGGIRLDRFLFSAVEYPTDYGFVPQTKAADGDHLDAMIIVSEPTFPGCLIETRVLGLFRMLEIEDDGERVQDDKILCVPVKDPNWDPYRRLEDVSKQLLDEISHFFKIYKQPENKGVEIQGWFGREEALAKIDETRAAYDRPGEEPRS